ncbi:MAG: hypothetical protein FD181_1373 [Prolixibacteraceae bacterium]|nr:MAG: hypothetical protein FD181_1373 [Prolixibacteraceae bacterium]
MVCGKKILKKYKAILRNRGWLFLLVQYSVPAWPTGQVQNLKLRVSDSELATRNWELGTGNKKNETTKIIYK